MQRVNLFIDKEVIMRKLRFFSTLLLLLFIFVGCDAPFEPSGCPEWDALIELQEENIKCVMFYDLATIKNESSAYVAPQPERYVPDNLLTHEQIEEWIALLKSLDCKFEKNQNANQGYYECEEGVSFHIWAEHIEYDIYITFYPDGYVVVENAVIGHQALYSATEKIDVDDYEKLYQFFQMKEDNT